MTLNPIRGTSAADTLTGISGMDEILGLDGNDRLTGGSGDLLRGGAGHDDLRVVAGLGETWSAIAGVASLFGEAGNDVLKLDPISGAGPSLLSGGDGTDYIHVRGLHRNLVVDGGLGVDLAWFNFIDVPPSAQDAAHLVLRADGTGHLDMGTDRLGTFVGLERVNLFLTSIGTDDVVVTAGGNNMIDVGDGANRVSLGDGDDSVGYRPGLANTLNGGPGTTSCPSTPAH